MFIQSVYKSKPNISYLLNELTYEEIDRLTSQNLKFIEKLSDREVKELWDNNLEESVNRDLKEIESRMNLISKFLNLS